MSLLKRTNEPTPPVPEKPMPSITDFVAFKHYIINKLLMELDPNLGNDRQMLHDHIRELFTLILAENNILLPKSEREKILDTIFAEILGLGPLEPLVNDGGVTEILVLGTKKVFVKKGGGWERVEIVFDDDDHVLRMLDRMTAFLGKSKMMSFATSISVELGDASQLVAFDKRLATSGQSAFILRKWQPIFRTGTALIEQDIITTDALALLEAAVLARLNIVICGYDDYGTLSLLNALAAFISEEAFVVTLENTAKLQLPQEKILALQSYGMFPTRYESNMAQLVQHALKMQPDYLVADDKVWTGIRELLGSSVPFMAILNSSSPSHTVDMLFDAYKKSETQVASQFIRQQIVSRVHVIVHVEQFANGLHRVTSISEIVETDDGFAVMPLFNVDKQSVDATLKQVGKLSSRLSHRLI